MYQIFKDFAGPVATVVAATIAAYFVRRQALIAEQQASTALDQLRYNLFEKRWAIYGDVKELILLLLNESHKENLRAIGVVPHYARMTEAIFFFPDDICDWMTELEKDCQKFLEARESKDTNPYQYAAAQHCLLSHLREMP